MINPELITQFSDAQNSFWQTASETIAAAAGESISLINPLVTAATPADLEAEFTGASLAVQFTFSETQGNPLTLLFPLETAIGLADLLGHEANEENFEVTVLPDLTPVLESFVNGLAEAIPTVTAASTPKITFGKFVPTPNLNGPNGFLRVGLNITCEEFSGTVLWLVDEESAATLSAAPGKSENADAGEVSAEFGSDMEFTDEAEISPFDHVDYVHQSTVGSRLPDDQPGLDLLMDIPLEISVELGRVKMPVRDVVELGAGSIVEIDKAAGEPVDVLVNGRLVARGEVVVIEDNFGVRITEILSPQERLQRLNEAA